MHIGYSLIALLYFSNFIFHVWMSVKNYKAENYGKYRMYAITSSVWATGTIIWIGLARQMWLMTQ